jgi:nitrite reductase/ring-hydroxylating ferredoxin subunit
MRVVDAGGREVGVVLWRGRFYALRNICPHLGAPVCLGTVSPLLTEGSEPWQLQVDETRLILACPQHRWEYDVATGASLLGNSRLKTYEVEVKDGRVLVEIGRREAGRE